MILKQLSIFLENKAGSVESITAVVAKAGINIKTFCIADGAEFGLLRIIVDDTDKCIKVLKEAGYSVFANDVVSATCSNKAGSLATLFNKLAANGISVEYMYAFQDGDEAKVVLRTKDIENCLKFISEYKG